MNKKIILLFSIVIAILLVFVFFRLGESNSPSAPQLQIMDSPDSTASVSVKETTQHSSSPTSQPSSETTNVDSLQQQTDTTNALAEQPAAANEARLLECLDKLSTKTNEQTGDYQTKTKKVLNLMAQSASQQERLTHALFTPSSEEISRQDLLANYIADYPKDALASLQALSLCSSNSEHHLCSKQTLNNAVELNRDNGAAWLSMLILAIEQENDEAALAATTAMAQSPQFNSGWGKRVKLFIDTMDTTAVNDTGLNVMSAIGIEAARPWGHSKLNEWCKTEINRPRIADACRTIGQVLASRSDIALEQFLGLAMQQNLFEAEENQAGIQQMKALHQEKMQAFQTDFDAQYFTLLTNENLVRNWLDTLDALGEVEATIQLNEDSKAWLEQTFEDTCSSL